MSEISSMLITHTKATVEDMERAWHGGLEDLLHRLGSHEFVEECAVLKTCNRVEVYIVSPKGSKVLLDFAKKMKVSSRIVDFLDHEDSLRHLLRLTSGLESMIIGEDQVLGQVKELFGIAKKAGTIGNTLDTAFSKAIQVGKRVRNETNINKGSVSIGSAAVELAEDLLGGLAGKTIMIIGAGEMGSLVARALANKGMKVIYVANRTYDKAEQLASELGGEAVRFEKIDEYLKLSDVVISATSAPHAILDRSLVENAAAEPRNIMLIDIGNPRNIEETAGELQGVRLYNLDSLKGISQRNLERRKEEARKAEEIVEEELALLKSQYKRQKADKIISAIYSMAEAIRKQERTEAINRLSAYHTMGQLEQEVIDDLTHSFANQFLAEPTKILRDAAENGDEIFLTVVAELFNINNGENRAKNNVSSQQTSKTQSR